MKDNTLRLKLISSLEKVLLNTEPKLVSESGTMLRNESHSFQIAVTAIDTPPYTIRHGFSIAVTGPAKDAVTVRYVEHMPCIMAADIVSDEYRISADAGLYPDMLVPFVNRTRSVIAGKWFSIWVTVDGRKMKKPGTYPIRFVFYDWDYNPTECTYTLTVMDEELPELRIPVTNWFHYDAIANYFKTEPFSRKFYSIFERYLKTYVEHGSNMLMLPIFTPPIDTHKEYERLTVQSVAVFLRDGKYTFDFTELKTLIDTAVKYGIKYFEISHLFSQWGALKCPKVMVNCGVVPKKMFGWESDALSAEYTGFLRVFLPELAAFLKQCGIWKECYFHLSDEPELKTLAHYKTLYGFIKEILPDATIFDALYAPEFVSENAIDIPIVPTYKSAPFLENNIPHWVYYTQFQREYYSNRLIALHAERTRILGLQLYLNNAGGYLHWGYNFYNSWLSVFPVDPMRMTDCELALPGGNAFVVYPDKENDDVFDSLRHELLLDAMQDYRLCCLVESRRGRQTVVDLLKSEGMQAYNVYPHSPEWLLSVIEKLRILLKQ